MDGDNIKSRHNAQETDRIHGLADIAKANSLNSDEVVGIQLNNNWIAVYYFIRSSLSAASISFQMCNPKFPEDLNKSVKKQIKISLIRLQRQKKKDNLNDEHHRFKLNELPRSKM